MKAQTWKLWAIWFVLGLASGWLFLQIAGCNTISGIGQDLQDMSGPYVERAYGNGY